MCFLMVVGPDLQNIFVLRLVGPAWFCNVFVGERGQGPQEPQEPRIYALFCNVCRFRFSKHMSFVRFSEQFGKHHLFWEGFRLSSATNTGFVMVVLLWRRGAKQPWESDENPAHPVPLANLVGTPTPGSQILLRRFFE